MQIIWQAQEGHGPQEQPVRSLVEAVKIICERIPEHQFGYWYGEPGSGLPCTLVLLDVYPIRDGQACGPAVARIVLDLSEHPLV
jgi:hypothetical protein